MRKNAETYELYLNAWAPVSADERVDMLRRSLAEEIVFTNPQQIRRGLADVVEHLECFQRRTPGGRFQMNNMFGWDRYGLAEWQLVDVAGKPGFSGSDVITFNDDGLIRTILLFGNVEAQKLAWRRRDPVALEPTR